MESAKKCLDNYDNNTIKGVWVEVQVARPSAAAPQKGFLPDFSAENFPSRPGQAACGHYMKTGTCRFGKSCQFDHPEWKENRPNPAAMAASLFQGKGKGAALKGKGQWARSNIPRPQGSVLRLTNTPDSITEEP